MTSTQDKIYSPAAVANNILWLARQEERPITIMKLLKLVYIVYGWVYAMTDRKVFKEPIQAWRHGPVVPSLYYQFQSFGSEPIDILRFPNSLKLLP